MSILPFLRRPALPAAGEGALPGFLDGFSLEVMPRTAAKIEDFRAIAPAGSRIYIAHIDGTPFQEMLATARRLAAEGMAPMPHFPARAISGRAELEAMIEAYAEAGVREALVLAGGIDRPRGDFHSSMQLLQTHLFDRAGFTRLHVAGHPEGNRDIDPDGSGTEIAASLRWKNDFQSRTDAAMALVTQFAFEAAPITAWADGLRAAGVTLPVHVGVAGPARLQTLIRFAMTCGVGASVRVLQRRAADLTRLVAPFEPDELLADLARHKAAHPECPIEGVHFFPLGGITATTDYVAARRGAGARHAARA
ncbi:methylenetetrahydrofolate reductase [soil metagenome]